MALRERSLGIGLVDHPVGTAAAGFFFDVIVHRVDGLAAVDAAGVIPVKAIVGGGGAHAGANAVVATAQQCQLFVERTGHLAFE